MQCVSPDSGLATIPRDDRRLPCLRQPGQEAFPWSGPTSRNAAALPRQGAGEAIADGPDDDGSPKDGVALLGIEV